MRRPPARRPAAAAGLLLAALLLPCCGDEEAPPAGPAAPIGGRPAEEYRIARDEFPALDDPATAPAAEAAFLDAEDEVFGVVVGGRARAYPVPVLAYHHVVNDVIEGIPVAVTY
jgi:hypothetical protein